MNDPERPPLYRSVLEQIEMLLDRVDQEHWSAIAAFQVSPAMLAKRPLPPPKTPAILLSTIQNYASMLFKREADQYEQFRKASNYAPWLWKVEERVIERVFRTVRAMELRNQPATLAYHGLTDGEIMQGLGEILWQIRSSYLWISGWPNPQQRPTGNETDPIAAAAIPSNYQLQLEKAVSHLGRIELRDAYLAAHPEAKKLDICWAAGQHYSEWKRWLRGVLRDGSTPDRAFRALLESGKSPREYKPRPRPDGWK